MIKIEKNMHYQLRLMPNKFDIPNSTISLEFCIQDEKPNMSKRHFSYILGKDGELDTFMYGETIKRFIDACFHGFYGTAEGYYICDSGMTYENGKPKIPKFYLANEDKSRIFSSLEDLNSYHIKDYKKHTEIFLYNKFNLFDIREEYVISFKTRMIGQFMEIYNVCRAEVKPLYKEGDDKEVINSLYNRILPLSECVENYKQNLSKENKNLKFLFNEDARKYYFKNRQKLRV